MKSKTLLSALALAVLSFSGTAHAIKANITPNIDDADVAHMPDYQLGWLSADEARLEKQEDVAAFLEQNGLPFDVGTYGGVRGSDYTTLRDVWSHLSNEKLQYFRMLLLYNVGERGPWAQTVRIYTRPVGSQFNYMDLSQWRLEKTWKISSGIGGAGKMRTVTGLYAVHPDRLTKNATAHSNRSADPMPNSMYIHYRYCAEGRDAGIATHGTSASNELRLGQRASAGCMRLSLQHSNELFTRIKVNREFDGPVPVVNFCNGSQQAPGSAELKMVRDANGNVITRRGVQALFVIHDDANPPF